MIKAQHIEINLKIISISNFNKVIYQILLKVKTNYQKSKLLKTKVKQVLEIMLIITTKINT